MQHKPDLDGGRLLIVYEVGAKHYQPHQQLHSSIYPCIFGESCTRGETRNFILIRTATHFRCVRLGELRNLTRKALPGVRKDPSGTLELLDSCQVVVTALIYVVYVFYDSNIMRNIYFLKKWWTISFHDKNITNLRAWNKAIHKRMFIWSNHWKIIGWER